MTVHTSSGEDLARYLGQDTLLFCSANDEWKKIFFFFLCFCFVCLLSHRIIFSSSSNTPLGAIPCALMLKRQRNCLDSYLARMTLLSTQLECKNLHLFLPLQKCLGKYCSLYRHK